MLEKYTLGTWSHLIKYVKNVDPSPFYKGPLKQHALPKVKINSASVYSSARRWHLKERIH